MRGFVITKNKTFYLLSDRKRIEFEEPFGYYKGDFKKFFIYTSDRIEFQDDKILRFNLNYNKPFYLVYNFLHKEIEYYKDKFINFRYSYIAADELLTFKKLCIYYLIRRYLEILRKYIREDELLSNIDKEIIIKVNEEFNKLKENIKVEFLPTFVHNEPHAEIQETDIVKYFKKMIDFCKKIIKRLEDGEMIIFYPVESFYFDYVKLDFLYSYTFIDITFDVIEFFRNIYVEYFKRDIDIGFYLLCYKKMYKNQMLFFDIKDKEKKFLYFLLPRGIAKFISQHKDFYTYYTIRYYIEELDFYKSSLPKEINFILEDKSKFNAIILDLKKDIKEFEKFLLSQFFCYCYLLDLNLHNLWGMLKEIMRYKKFKIDDNINLDIEKRDILFTYRVFKFFNDEIGNILTFLNKGSLVEQGIELYKILMNYIMETVEKYI
ncbi:MAG: hypothetical protein QXO40_00045 [Candidatus Aenigmatarchaeota archaeon]